ncbi:hypothetical protein Glove_420g86 [Diversispora epigaea]|uniref:Protein kinase domain-containing protein n=1 Tax=Diversispora epigaea TaxID=1348612 RepID=A0A397GVX1_9GLOM|nr:hypothetical protein Glove_420g86 [Diversispora epigaea]
MPLYKECNQEFNILWCMPCNSTRFKNDFDKWTSGNETIDKFIQNAQINADWHMKLLAWIPYDRFKDIKQIAKGGFSTIYYAGWIDGYIKDWDIENQQWERSGRFEVVLKKFDGIRDLNEDFLNEISIHLKSKDALSSINFFGITKDPKSRKYMMVLEYFKGGSLRYHLNDNNIDWKMKLAYLSDLAFNFKEIHKLGIIHQDLHPGNILSCNFNVFGVKISDFGLSKLIGKNVENPQKKNIFGVLPYIAPEVLNGNDEYTKAADVYSFAIIAYEIITGFQPYSDVPHDEELALKICNGLRPKIPFYTPKLIIRIIMRCWDARVTHRPTFKELKKELDKYSNNYEWNKNSEITIQIDKAEEFSKNQEAANTTPLNYKTHPQAIYTSRLLNFSDLPKPKNEENFEKELEKLSHDDIDEF